MSRVLQAQQPPMQKQREWQKYRGWSPKILEVLEHSGGMTTRAISDAIGKDHRQCSVKLCQMRCDGTVEKKERWGWNITPDGLSILYTNVVSTTFQQRFNNVSTTFQQRFNKM